MAEIEGLNKVLKNLSITVDEIDKNSRKATDENAQDLLSEAIPLTPFKTGQLRESGKIIKTKDSSEEYMQEVSFGGGQVNYAAAVHEMPTKRMTTSTINWSEPGTGAKFLEIPLNRNLGKYRQNIIDKAKVK